ncbi:MAG: ROK family protein [Elusimicrobia bacterium]|nr:ROK family protein [Elusimicrobiota bacterium]MDE2236670.1 ROK family protein [Elusimicrobiota bacterium]MDE2426633.1 ROK family protein [Elusimicrobiota bacterium]
MPELCIGVDVGGTYTKIGVVERSGRLRLERRLDSQAQQGPAAFVERVCSVIKAWTSQGVRPVGLGLGIAGDVDSRKGSVRLSPNLPGWAGFDFKRALGRRLRLPVAVENDANAAVFGAYVAQLKRKPRHVVGATLGTGLGGGLVIDGRLHRGATGSAGELGHTKVQPGGELCHCGDRGCLEAYAGGYGILRLARRLALAKPGQAKRLLSICGELDALEPVHLTLAAEAGDPVARQTWIKTGQMLAIGLENFVLIVNPDVVLILGGVSRAGRWILEPIRRHFARQPFRMPFSRARLALADNADAGCVGAALLALEPEARADRC